MYRNNCQYGQCKLEFADLYDLIQHIEEAHIPPDGERRGESTSQVACLPLSTICRYFQKLPETPPRPIVPEPTFQQPAPNIPSGAQAAAMAAAAAASAMAAASVKKRIPSIIAQSSQSSAGGSGLVTSGGQPQTANNQSSILFHPPANVAGARSSGATPAGSHISDGDDGRSSVGRESLSSESSMVHEDGVSEVGSFYKIITPPKGSLDERRFVCNVPGCKKSYKNMNGIRYHIKCAHMNHLTNPDDKPNGKKFRCQCNKAYKTSHGLHNHMLQTNHRQAPVPSPNPMSSPTMGSGGGNSKYGHMAGVSASGSPYKRGLPGSMSSGGESGPMTGPKHQRTHGPPSSLNSNYYTQSSSMKSGGVGGGNSSNTTTLPSGVSVQVSNLGGGAPTTVQVGQQGALGAGPGGGGGGPMGSGPGGSSGQGQGLHISAGRRLSSTHHMHQQHMGSMGGRPLKIHSAGGGGGGIQALPSSGPSGVNAYNSTVTTMGGSGGNE